MFRRRVRPPEPPWRARVDDARRLIDGRIDQPWMRDRLDALEAALVAAEEDHAQLTAAIAQLDPERVTRELKDALRAKDRGSDVDEALVATLRRRHDVVHQLLNRSEALRSRIDTTVADLELLAARTVEVSLTNRTGELRLDDELARLHADLGALEAAHDELRDL